MEFFPLFLRIQDRDCVVIGGGEVAARKVALLRRAGGRVRVILSLIHI
jgi:uroporphyrin-III C-methyltransferase/precorrin-2 dehydrogenase/sirohydrochlorin ferrochelatase